MLISLVLVLLTGAAVPAADPVLQIQHEPSACLLEGTYARIEAVIRPAAEARATLYFHAEGEAAWHGVPMRADGAVWVAALPKPRPGTRRIGYFIVARRGATEARQPDTAAYLADVVPTACSGGTFASAPAGPTTLLVPAGAPRVPPGFEPGSVSGYIEGGAEPLVPRASLASLRPPSPLTPGARVRVGVKSGKPLVGAFRSLDADEITLTKGKQIVRVPASEMVSLEVGHKASSATRALGGLGGAAAGFAVGILVCASGEGCETIAPVWGFTAAGILAGSMATNGTDWQAVEIASRGPVALRLEPHRGGAALGVKLGF